MDEEWSGRGIHPDERPINCAWCLCEHTGSCATDPEHGQEGHTGFRCRLCASESGYYDENDNFIRTDVLIEESSGDYWQTKQLQWQESCDVIFRKFDNAVADHLPEHEPVNCETCPIRPEFPAKPLPPTDRVDKQLSKRFITGSDQDYAE